MKKTSTQLKPIESRVYSYWTALYQSFYSSALYVDVGKRWKGIGLLYLLLVISLLSLPFSFKIMKNFTEDFNQNLMEPIKEMPLLYIQSGKISIDKPLPYSIKNNRNQVVILIDTQSKAETFPKEYPELTIFITENKIMFLPPSPVPAQFKTQDLAKRKPIVQKLEPTSNGIFSGKLLVEDKSIKRMKLFAQVMVYPMVVALFYGVSVVMFPAYALLAQFFSSIFFKYNVAYKRACRLLIVSATPMILLLFIILFFNINFSGIGFIGFFLLIGYFCFAVHSLKKESLRLARG